MTRAASLACLSDLVPGRARFFYRPLSIGRAGIPVRPVSVDADRHTVFLPRSGFRLMRGLYASPASLVSKAADDPYPLLCPAATNDFGSGARSQRIIVR